eukprot:scaffold4261_cov110-Isochrysis_galbana.AAC.3
MCYTFQGLARAPHRYPVRARPVRARKAVATHHRSFTRRAAGVQSFIVAANVRWQNTQEVKRKRESREPCPEESRSIASAVSGSGLSSRCNYEFKVGWLTARAGRPGLDVPECHWMPERWVLGRASHRAAIGGRELVSGATHRWARAT